MTNRRSFRALIVIVMLLVAAPAVFAAAAKGKSGKSEKREQASRAERGELAKAPPAATASAQFRLDYPDLATMLNRDSSNLPVVHRPDGSQMIDLQGGFRSVMVVYTTPTGDRVVTCVESLRAAERIFTPQTPETPKEP